MNIEKTLKERGDRYGSFAHHAEISQKLQDILRAEVGWSRQAPDQKQALTTICDKIARMLNGDPNYRDNWHDIVGYAKLVDDRMAADESVKRVAMADASYETQPTDKDGFHNWSGNIMAPCPLDSIVTVRYTGGDQNTGSARSFNWLHVGEPLNHIVGWKYASAVPEQPWNDHFGGPMAPFKTGALVQVWFREAKQPVTKPVNPKDLRWEHHNQPGDIIRWRYAS